MKVLVPVLELLRRFFAYIDRLLSFSYLPRMKKAGKNIYLGRGFTVEHPECVSLGDHVYFNDYCWISVAIENPQDNSPLNRLRPEITIGSNTYIGRFTTLACINRVTIGSDVVISDRVFIGDAFHGFRRTDVPIKDQHLVSKGPVSIGDGTWIGIGACILSNVRVGRNCIIGSNAVVTHDVPDYHVAAGVPARILRKL